MVEPVPQVYKASSSGRTSVSGKLAHRKPVDGKEEEQWSTPTTWICASLALYIVLQPVIGRLAPHDPAAREDLLKQVSLSTYGKAAASFFILMALNLVSFIFEENSDRRALALLLALVNGLGWHCAQQLLGGHQAIMYNTQGFPFQPCRLVQWLITLPTLLFILSKMSAAPKPQVAVALVIEAMLVVCTALASLTPVAFTGLGLLLLTAHSYVLWTANAMVGSALKSIGSAEGRSSVQLAARAYLLLRTLLFVATAAPAFMPQLAGGAELLLVGCDVACKFIFSTCIISSNFTTSAKKIASPGVDSCDVGALKKEVEQLKSQIAAKDKWIRVVGSEMKAPLTAVIQLGNALSRGSGGRLSDRGAGWVQTIVDGGNHLFGIINDILLVGAMGSGALRLTQELVYVDVIVDQVLRSLSPLLSKGVLIEKAIASNLPPIIGDSARIKQIISNLVDNSLKYTVQGKVQVRVRHDLLAGSIVIKVVDTGCGIPTNKLQSIWGSEGKERGSGTGLAFVKLLVAAHEGEIDVESVEGQGSTFVVRLPVMQRGTRKSLEIIYRAAYAKSGFNANHLPQRSLNATESGDNGMEGCSHHSRSRRSSLASSTGRRSEDRGSSRSAGFVTTLCSQDLPQWPQ